MESEKFCGAEAGPHANINFTSSNRKVFTAPIQGIMMISYFINLESIIINEFIDAILELLLLNLKELEQMRTLTNPKANPASTP